MGEVRPLIRVLLADDNSLVRMSLARALRSAGDIEVAGEASTGLEAVEIACRLRPDLVLMDISLPGMDGIEATRRIKEACPEVRVVGLSMYTDADERMRAAGATGCLDKATPVAQLLVAIRLHAARGGVVS
jgi:DNA-binding NarL/FixJ family response regulator